MADFTEVTTEGWGSRIMSSIKGVLFGVGLFLASFVVLWWNEGRAIQTERGLDEGASQVTTIGISTVDASNEGKLVHLTGLAETESILKDDKFGVELNALKLRRSVEIYQWVEIKEENTEKKVGGGTETTTTYDYVKSWDSDLINSDEFKVPEEHTNPKSFPFGAFSKEAEKVMIGAFEVPYSLVNNISNYKSYPITTLDTIAIKNSKLIDAGVVYIGAGTDSNPQIGDIKLNFSVIEPGQYSIVSKQINNTFEEFGTSQGTTINMISAGVVSSENMFQAAQDENTLITWILRLAGFLMMAIGLAMIFNPLVILADVLPFLGTMLGMGVSLMAGIISFMLSFITIAIAWIKYRPILGVSLLVVGIGVFVLFYLNAKKKKKLKAATATSTTEK